MQVDYQTEREMRLLDLADALAQTLERMADMQQQCMDILQAALGLREGLRAPDELDAPTVDLTGKPIKGMR